MAEKLASLKKKGGGKKDFGIICTAANSNNGVNSNTAYTSNSDLFTVPSAGQDRTCSMTVKKGGKYHYILTPMSRGTGSSYGVVIGSTSITVTSSPQEGDITIGDNTVCTVTASCTNNYFSVVNLMLIQT